MHERLHQPSGSGRRTARRRTQRSSAAVPPPRGGTETSPTLFGFPAEMVPDDGPDEPVGSRAADHVLTVHRRADVRAGGTLVLAGVATNLSLLLPWSAGQGPVGLWLVEQGVDVLRSGWEPLARSDVWQPLAVVSCGGLLLLLGLLLFVPARTHRLLGVLALLVASAAAAAVVDWLAGVGWETGNLAPGAWCAAAVPVLGVLGALQAMLTDPLVSVVPVEGAGTVS